MTGLIAFLVRLGFSGMVDKTIKHMEFRAELQNDRERLKSETAVEFAKQAVIESKALTDFNKSKLSFPWFWLFAALFVLPLGLYFASVITYSVLLCADCAFPQSWTIAALPSPLDEWSARMIAWIFYVGSGVGLLRNLK